MTEEKQVRVVSDGRRLDVLLSEASGLTRSRVASLMEEGCCVSGGKECRKAGTKIPEGQEIILTVPAPREAAPKAEEIPLEVLYEDDDLAVVIKPRGMVVHPAAGHPDGTLVNALLFQLDSLGSIGGELRPGIVHRLDRDTSGLMLVAKNDEAQAELSRMLKDREIEKHYRALAEGVFEGFCALDASELLQSVTLAECEDYLRSRIRPERLALSMAFLDFGHDGAPLGIFALVHHVL